MRLPFQPARDLRQTPTLVLTSGEHRVRHVMLFRALYELVGDWVSQTPGAGAERPVAELIRWSQAQAQQPTASPLPVWHEESDFRCATLRDVDRYRGLLLRGAVLCAAVGLGAALVLYLLS